MGWREWLALPEFSIPAIKAKIDTGARSSSLHVVDIQVFERAARPFVRCRILPLQRSERDARQIERELVGFRTVRSSNGQASHRPVIVTEVRWQNIAWPVELTLTDRSCMRFRLLLGRKAIQGLFVVDPGHSYLGGRPVRRPHDL
jgi:hypothetical protein